MKRHNSIISMTITKENYEFYALDFLEGNLDAATQQAMEQFLAKHPDVAAEMQAMQEVVLVPEPELVFEPKSTLKKKGASLIFLRSWAKYAAAAVLILGLVWVVMQNENIGQQPQQVVEGEKQEQLVPQHKQMPLDETPKTVIAEKKTPTHTQENKIQKPSKKQPKTNPEKVLDKSNTVPKTVKQVERKQPEKQLEAIEEDKLEQQTPEIVKPKQLSSKMLATLEPKPLKQTHEQVVLEMAAESLVKLESTNPAKVKRNKHRKNLFEQIDWKQVVEAFIPESFIAAK